jgi:3-hydroxyisobutyrate dehydrogenase
MWIFRYALTDSRRIYMKKIAWIGTGVMGKPMVLHLSKAHYQVLAYNRTFEKAKMLEPAVTACKSIQECVKDADIIFSIVGYPQDVREIYDEVFQYASKGTILVDMTTSSPALAKDLYQEAKSLGLHMLDAPVTGGDLGAINATLSIMVGGDENIFEQVKPMFELLGKRITYMGNPGNGQHAKLANQIVIAGNIAGVAEALTYASSKGLNLEKALSVFSGGSAQSWQADKNGPKMVVQDYQPGFFIKHYLKDLRLAINESGELALDVLQQVTAIYEKLVELGFSESGTQAIIEYYKLYQD